MTKQLTLGTAKIEEANGIVTVSWMDIGSFLIGEQHFGNSREGYTAALRFIRQRGLRVL